MNDQVDSENESIDKAVEAGRDSNDSSCGPGCDCDTIPGLSTRGKVVICLVVGLAAAVVLGRGFMKKAGAENGGDQQVFATALPVAQIEPAASVDEAAKAKEEEQQKPKLWGKPLDSLASLNKVAGEKDAVFVFLSSGNEESEKTARNEIEAAARKIMSRGTTMAAYILKKDTRDYAQVTSQVPVPCVLAMVKGRGMGVAKDITEANLIQALVAASRPSGCGPAAAGSSCCP
ncbi:hypothetical protein ACFLQR_01030 [Verrucomicrobiota bacterium]